MVLSCLTSLESPNSIFIGGVVTCESGQWQSSRNADSSFFFFIWWILVQRSCVGHIATLISNKSCVHTMDSSLQWNILTVKDYSFENCPWNVIAHNLTNIVFMFSLVWMPQWESNLWYISLWMERKELSLGDNN